MYDGQVIPWTQRKCQAENLVGGGLRVVGQGESSSDQQDKHPNLAHSYPSSRQPNPVVPSGMFYLPVTPPPDPDICVVGGNQSGEVTPTQDLVG